MAHFGDVFGHCSPSGLFQWDGRPLAAQAVHVGSIFFQRSLHPGAIGALHLA